MGKLQELLNQSAARHAHLCPRQVLGVRMGLLSGEVLGLDLPLVDKRLFTFVECAGCGMGGIEVATGCRVDRRTMRVMDYGKLAATFVDTQTGRSVRIKPHPACRLRAEKYAPQCRNAWHSQLEAYQILSSETLLMIQPVELSVSLEKIISLPGLRAICEGCGEEITNQREIMVGGRVLCRACAGDNYYSYPGQTSNRRALLSPASGMLLKGRGNGSHPNTRV